MAAFTFLLRIPSKGNQPLFGCYTPQNVLTLSTTPGKFNSGSRCIKKECPLLSWYISVETLCIRVSLFTCCEQGGLRWCWRQRIPHVEPGHLFPGDCAIFFPILGKLWLLNQLKPNFPSPTALTNTVPVSYPSCCQQSWVTQLLRWGEVL